MPSLTLQDRMIVHLDPRDSAVVGVDFDRPDARLAVYALIEAAMLVLNHEADNLTQAELREVFLFCAERVAMLEASLDVCTPS